ncbi:hypothetical protein AMELA_G00167040 [Ameiurus melas]|uniref:Uncharacterized protein n=1 Tax=Ameiurus melas TaxID=219545 RepID=A0A7J6ABF6_AMEME|nr:hypothetical protein AMELA_G00167040 [Ameiurus melas]
MAAEAPVTPPAAATPTPTAVTANEAPMVIGARMTPPTAAATPNAPAAPPVMPAIFTPLWTLSMLSATSCSSITWLCRFGPRSARR